MALALFALALPRAAWAQMFEKDPTFDESRVWKPGKYYELSYIQPDGKIWVLEESPYAGISSLTRLKADGSHEFTLGKISGAEPRIRGAFKRATPPKVHPMPNGEVLVVGDFFNEEIQKLKHFIRVRPDGSHYYYPDIKLALKGEDRHDSYGLIEYSAVQPDGKIIVSGRFNWVEGYGDLPSKYSTIRLHPDGSVDTSFEMSSLGKTEYKLKGMELSPNGNITIFTGREIEFGGINGNSINLIDVRKGNGEYNAIFARVVQPDGKILVGGAFGTYDEGYYPNRTPSGVVLKNLARFNADGTLDVTFSNNVKAQNLRPIRDMHLQPDGKIVIRVAEIWQPYIDYWETGGYEIIRLNADGTRDNSFKAPAGFDWTGIYPQVDGSFLATFFAKHTNYVDMLVRLKPDGRMDTGFQMAANQFPNTPPGRIGFEKVRFTPEGKIAMWVGYPYHHLMRLAPSTAYSPVTKQVLTDVQPAGAGQLSCTPNPVPWGGSTRCTATANAGYTLNSFHYHYGSRDHFDCRNGACDVKTLTHDLYLKALFEPSAYNFSGTANPPAGGTVSCAPARVAAHAQGRCTISASPGFVVSSVQSTGAECELNSARTQCLTEPIEADTAITVNFVPQNTAPGVHTIHINVVGSTAGSTVTCTPNPVPTGGSAVCTPNAGPGEGLKSFSGPCTGYSCNLSNVTSDLNLTATFAKRHPVTVQVLSGEGSGRCIPAGGTPEGNAALCRPEPAAGYEFDHYETGDCDMVLPRNYCRIHQVMGPRTVRVHFKPVALPSAIDLRISPPGAGVVSCTPNPVPQGGNASCTVSSTTQGYQFMGFSGDCTGSTCNLNNVTSPKSVVAEFKNLRLFEGITVPPSGTGGPAVATLSGGGAGCQFDETATAFVAAPAAAPGGQTLPHGALRFKLMNCDHGSTVSVSVQWPGAVDGALKYGRPDSSATNDSYYAHPGLSASGNVTTITLTDGGQGDEDGVANGEIRDPLVATKAISAGPIGVTAVPTLGHWSLMLLGLAAAGLGARRLRKAA